MSSSSLHIVKSQSNGLIFIFFLLNLLYSLMVSLTSGLLLSTAFSIYFFLNSSSLVSNLITPALLCSSSIFRCSIFFIWSIVLKALFCIIWSFLNLVLHIAVMTGLISVQYTWRRVFFESFLDLWHGNNNQGFIKHRDF